MRQCLRSWKALSSAHKTLVIDIVGYINIVQEGPKLGWIDLYRMVQEKTMGWVSRNHQFME